MAGARHTTRDDARSMKSKRDAAFAEMAKQGNSASRTIRVLSKVIAETLEEIHGKKARVDLDPLCEFVMIRLI